MVKNGKLLGKPTTKYFMGFTASEVSCITGVSLQTAYNFMTGKTPVTKFVPYIHLAHQYSLKNVRDIHRKHQIHVSLSELAKYNSIELSSTTTECILNQIRSAFPSLLNNENNVKEVKTATDILVERYLNPEKDFKSNSSNTDEVDSFLEQFSTEELYEVWEEVENIIESRKNLSSIKLKAVDAIKALYTNANYDEIQELQKYLNAVQNC